MSECIGIIRSVHIGKSVPFTRPGTFSAIEKKLIKEAVHVGQSGLDGDEQGDRKVHGGPEKAVHVYPWKHYASWQLEWPTIAQFCQPGAFGENFSVVGPDEWNVCLGDQWLAGSAVFEVSQGRQPCWKLNHRFGIPDMSRRVQDSLRAGWYLRVISFGAVQEGDLITLCARPYPAWSIASLLSTIRDRNCDERVLQEILKLPLPASWLRLFQRRLESGNVESWETRLEGERNR